MYVFRLIVGVLNFSRITLINTFLCCKAIRKSYDQMAEGTVNAHCPCFVLSSRLYRCQTDTLINLINAR